MVKQTASYVAAAILLSFVCSGCGPTKGVSLACYMATNERVGFKTTVEFELLDHWDRELGHEMARANDEFRRRCRRCAEERSDPPAVQLCLCNEGEIYHRIVDELLALRRGRHGASRARDRALLGIARRVVDAYLPTTLGIIRGDRWPPPGLDERLNVTDFERAWATLRARGVDLDKERYSSLRRAAMSAREFGGLPPGLLEHVAQVLQETSLTSRVSFRTFREGELVDGAVVRYRLITDTGEPGRVNGLTSKDARKDLGIGWYYIWAQRDGRQSSSTRERFDVFEEVPPPIDLVENR